MSMKKKMSLLCYAAVTLTLASCTMLGSAEIIPTATLAPGATAQAGLPRSEAGVPRVTPQDAKAAVERGEAVIVDVRSPDAFARGHVAGALFIPLGEVESNADGLDLDKDQWIITYCT